MAADGGPDPIGLVPPQFSSSRFGTSDEHMSRNGALMLTLSVVFPLTTTPPNPNAQSRTSAVTPPEGGD